MHTLRSRCLKLAFLLSGCSALMLQLGWQRLLVPWLGGDVGAISLVVAVFMIGLALGGALGGRLGRMRSAVRCLHHLIMAELLVIFFTLIGLLGHAKMVELADSAGLSPDGCCLALIGLSMAPSSVAMGVSFPLLVKVLGTTRAKAGAVAAGLTALNTLGAAVGALLMTWVIFPQVGISKAIGIALIIDGVVVLLALVAARAKRIKAGPTDGTAHGEGSSSLVGCQATWIAGAMLAGFGCLGSEMLFFRVLGATCKPSAQTMGSLLFLYLAAIAAGSTWGARSNASREHVRGSLFALLAWAFALTSVIPVLAIWLIQSCPWREYLAGYEPLSFAPALAALRSWMDRGNGGDVLALYLGVQWLLPAVIMLPSGFLFGACQVRLQRVAINAGGDCSWIVGWIQFWGVAGAVLGTLGVWWVGFPLLGSSGLLKFFLIMGGLSSLLASRSIWRLVWVAAAVAGMVLMPDQRQLWSMVHGERNQSLIVAEDSSGVSVIRSLADGSRVFYVNGIGQSWMPYGGIHTQLGALPLLLHPCPERVALIGLGSGDTLNAMLCRSETRMVLCAEIVGSQIRSLRELSRQQGMQALRHLLEDVRVQFRVQDGRRMLQQDGIGFDVIEVDAMRPTSAHSGALYSVEFFRLAKAHLRPGGVVVSWLPTQRAAETMAKVFPHLMIVAGSIGLGSLEPLVGSASAWQSLLAQRSLQNHFWRSQVDIVAEITAVMGPQSRTERLDEQYNRERLRDLNTDDFPRDEMQLPGLWGQDDP